MLAPRRMLLLASIALLSAAAFPGTSAGPALALAPVADAAVPAPDCKEECNEDFETCRDLGIDTDVCEQLWGLCRQACDAALPGRAAAGSAQVPPPSAPDCRDSCNEKFYACMEAGIDTDVCEELWRKCVAACGAIDTGSAAQVSASAGPAAASAEDVAALLDLVHGLDGKGLLPADLLADATATLLPGPGVAVPLQDLDRVFLRVKALLAGLAGASPTEVADASVSPGSVDLAAIPCPDCQQVFHICEEVCELVLDYCEELFGPHWGPIICRSLTDFRCTDLCEIVASACWTVCRLLPALPADQAALTGDWSAGLPTLSCQRLAAADVPSLDEALPLAL